MTHYNRSIKTTVFAVCVTNHIEKRYLCYVHKTCFIVGCKSSFAMCLIKKDVRQLFGLFLVPIHSHLIFVNFQIISIFLRLMYLSNSSFIFLVNMMMITQSSFVYKVVII